MMHETILRELANGHIIVLGTICPYRQVAGQVEYFNFVDGKWIKATLSPATTNLLANVRVLKDEFDIVNAAIYIPKSLRKNFVESSIQHIRRTKHKQGHFI
jgi:hypothetical protein